MVIFDKKLKGTFVFDSDFEIISNSWRIFVSFRFKFEQLLLVSMVLEVIKCSKLWSRASSDILFKISGCSRQNIDSEDKHTAVFTILG